MMIVRGMIFVGVLVGSSAVPGSAPTSGDAVIRAMHDRYANSWYKTLTFSQKTSLRTKADTMAMEVWDEEALFPGRLRVLLHRKTGDLTAMYAGDSLFIWQGDSVLQRAQSRNILLIMGFDVYAQPAERTLDVLAKEHYPMTPVREDTWEGRPVYVIGNGTRQLWIDKDRLLFVRAVQPSDGDSTKIEDFRFDNYVQVPSGWVSETVETYVDGKIIQREEYYDVRVNPTLDPQRFIPPGGKSR
jgi:hypothetical protein